MSDPTETAPPEETDPSPPEGEVRATFFDHLTELRIRLVRALLGVAVGVAVTGWFAERLFRYVMQPVLDSLPEGQRALNYTSSLEPFLVYLKVALYGGLFLAAPWVLFQLWLFIAPGSTSGRRSSSSPSSPSGRSSSTAGLPSPTSGSCPSRSRRWRPSPGRT